MIFLIIIHLFSPPQLTPKTLDGWPPSIARSGWPSSDALFPRDFTTPAFGSSQKPMPSMEYCERFVARLPTDKGTLLYCVDVGRKDL